MRAFIAIPLVCLILAGCGTTKATPPTPQPAVTATSAATLTPTPNSTTPLLDQQIQAALAYTHKAQQHYVNVAHALADRMEELLVGGGPYPTHTVTAHDVDVFDRQAKAAVADIATSQADLEAVGDHASKQYRLAHKYNSCMLKAASQLLACDFIAEGLDPGGSVGLVKHATVGGKWYHKAVVARRVYEDYVKQLPL
jgi:hypothetical protein